MLGSPRYERHENDAYDTPAWCTKALLQHWTPRGMVWDPACGAGAITDVFKALGVGVMLSDIQPRCDTARADFLGHGSPGDGLFSIVTNPPYNLAEEFVRHALTLTERAGGDVAMLLRNEWDCAAGRNDLFTVGPFHRKIVLTKRPRWIEGSTGSPRHNFAWFVWSWGGSMGNGPAIRWSV